MLHREDSEGIILIRQPAHAWLSGQLARAWGNEKFGAISPWEEVCLGAEQHDIGWLFWETSPTLNQKTGRPHNFMEMPRKTHINLWSSGVQLALSLGKYIALLVSLHGTALYAKYDGKQDSPEDIKLVENFLSNQHNFQQEMQSSLLADPYYARYATGEMLARNRRLIAVWDLLSLLICLGFGQQYEVDRVPDKIGETKLTLTSADDPTQIIIDPWPFSRESVTLVFQGQRLPEKFSDEEMMRGAISRAPWVTINTSLHPV